MLMVLPFLHTPTTNHGASFSWHGCFSIAHIDPIHHQAGPKAMMVSQVGLIVGTFSAVLAIGLILMYCHFSAVDRQRVRQVRRRKRARVHTDNIKLDGISDSRGRSHHARAFDPPLDTEWHIPRSPPRTFTGHGTRQGRGCGGQSFASTELT